MDENSKKAVHLSMFKFDSNAEQIKAILSKEVAKRKVGDAELLAKCLAETKFFKDRK